MKVILSVSSKVRDPKENKENAAKLTQEFATWFSGVKACLEKKYGKVTGKPEKLIYDGRNNKFDTTNYSVLKFKSGSVSFFFRVMVFTEQTFKEGKLLARLTAGEVEKKMPAGVLTPKQISKVIFDAVPVLQAKAEKQKAAPKDPILAKAEAAYASKVKKARADADKINDILPGDRVAVRKSHHLGIRTAYVEVLGTSDKVRGMTIDLNEDGTKFYVGVCPKGFLGGDEYWPDERFQNKALNQANLEAALKKNGFSLD